MSTSDKAKMIVVVFATGIMVWFAVLAIQFGNKLSKNCEQQYTNAILKMSGK
jgi:hypothetical protein